MSPDEYISEWEYLDKNYQRLIDGTYVPLWKQNKVQ